MPYHTHPTLSSLTQKEMVEDIKKWVGDKKRKKKEPNEERAE